MSHGRKIGVVGLGYVGLPVAAAFGRSGSSVIGFDIDPARILELQAGKDRTREVSPEDLARPTLTFTTDPAALRSVDFFIVTVPTPIDEACRPDLRALLRASETVGNAIRRGGIVVYELTVYPGATEEDCVPALERASGLKAGHDFGVGYSPERINPGDMAHPIRRHHQGGGRSGRGHTRYRHQSVRFSCQSRYPQGALNQSRRSSQGLSAICHQLDIDTSDVLAAARTKWNFLPFTPGLVGGHCIGVDPYYLTHRAEKAGYHPEVILAGRRINNGVGERIARECLRRVLRNGSTSKLVTVLGLTFKENVPDIRNSRVIDIIRELQSFGATVQVHDPLALPSEAMDEYGIELMSLEMIFPADAVVFAVPHSSYVVLGWSAVAPLLKNGRGLVIDVKATLDRKQRPKDIELWRL